MYVLALVFALSTAHAAPTLPPLGTQPFMAVLAETASGFETVAECERALDGSGGPGPTALRGSLFNRANGNISRCEIVDGEPLIVVQPRPFATLPR